MTREATSDRELLELAAKAAGIIYSEIDANGVWIEKDNGPYGQMSICWNPLADDGDALRLAVKLYLWEAIRLAHRLVGTPGCPDIYAATRRAIVRAAAEIGRAMP